MKELFPGFYPSSSGALDLSAGTTLVAFDANVLLNLYRYPTSASEDILRLMEGLKEKVWLPYHAALEYHRNRLVVVADQKKRFREARAVVEKGINSLESELGKLQLLKRHSTIDITTLLTSLHNSRDAFFKTLEGKEKAQRDVTDDDPTRTRIEAIFSTRIGPPPEVAWIKELEKEGKLRYESKCPPGYCDVSKEGESFTHRGITYRRELGDLILWKQLLLHAKANKVAQLVLVTDDDKEDWWLDIDSGGSKRVGPRPELIEEAKREAEVHQFVMLNSERFASLFAKLLKIKVGADTVAQVEDVKSTLSESVTVTCPSCGHHASVRIGRTSGSSAFPNCEACRSRYHVHRGSDGEVFTKAWGGKTSMPVEPVVTSHRVEAICPKCSEVVPANIRDDESSTKRYCMNCCSLLTIDPSGAVPACQPSSALKSAEVFPRGHFSYLTCPDCPDTPPSRSIWGNGTLVRSVCPSCGKLIEGTAGKVVEKSGTPPEV